MNINIEIRDEFAFQRSGVTMTVDMTALSADMIAELVYHGLTQKVGDAAAGLADDEKAAREKMHAVLDRLLDGEWTGRRASANDEHGAYRTFIRNIIRAAIKASPAKAKEYKAAEDRNAYLDAIFDAQSDDKRDAIIARAKHLAKEMKAQVEVNL
jgi:hypothetical protein